MSLASKIVLVISILFASDIAPQSLYFPPTSGDTWDTISAARLGWNTQYTDSLFTYLQDNNSKAFILLKDGKIVFEKYFGSFSRDSIWYWASAGKTLTAFAIGLARQEGKLSLDSPVSGILGNHWTSVPADKENLITVRNQLSMTTGLNDNGPDPDCTLPDCLTYKADAGTRWAYHNAPYTLLDSVIIKSTGQSLISYIYQHLHASTGFSGIFLRSGFNNVFCSTARNMALFGLLLLNRGTWDQQSILHDSVYFYQMTHSSQQINPSYGYLTWLNGQSSYMVPQSQFVFPGFLAPAAPADMFAALGKNGQFINVIPSMNMVWIRMGDAPDNSLVPFLLNDRIWQKLNPILRVETNIDLSGQKQEGADQQTFQIKPNPSSGDAIITFKLNNAAPVRLQIFNITGQTVGQLESTNLSAGTHTFRLAEIMKKQLLASGIYLCCLQVENHRYFNKIVVTK